MTEPSQLTPSAAQEQQLYSKFPMDDRAPRFIFKPEPVHHMEKAWFITKLTHIGDDPHLMILGESWNVDRSINEEISLWDS